MAESLDDGLKDIDVVFLVWTASAESREAAAKRIAERVGRLVLLGRRLSFEDKATRNRRA